MKIGEWWRGLRLLSRRDRAARELDEELKLHEELRTQAYRADGMSADAAARAARRRFGNPTVLREDARDAWGWVFVERLAQDARYALRQLHRHRASTVATVLTLALGIAATTSMFTLLNATLFASPPARDPGRLVWLAETRLPSGGFRYTSYPDYVVFRNRPELFDGVIAFTDIDISLGDAVPERARGLLVSGNYFDVLGLSAQTGRTLHASDDGEPGAHPVVVLSDGLWRRRYAGDQSIVGRAISINGHPFDVVGVAPAGFAGLEMDERVPDVWLPLAMAGRAMPDSGATLLNDAGAGWLRIVARLAPQVSRDRADAAMRTIGQQQFAAAAPEDAQRTITVLPLIGGLDPSNRREAAPVLSLLMIVPALVLLVACANAGNLLLARGVDRRREIALRRALGASRGRVTRQLLTESLLLALTAGAVGLALSSGLTRLIGLLGDVPAGVMATLHVDWRVLAATTVTAVAAGVIFGLAPSLAVSNPALVPALKDGAGATVGPRRRLRSLFVISQVAGSLVLLIVAGLLMRSLSKALNVDPGFDTTRTMTLSFDLGLQGYDAPARGTFVGTLLERTKALPGVSAAAVTSVLPLGGRMTGTDIQPEGDAANGRAVGTGFSVISPAYFDVMQTPLVRGRAFTDADAGQTSAPVIINERLAQMLWPDAEAIGKRVRLESGGAWREVVGVVRNSKYHSLTEDPRAFCFLPMTQTSSSPWSLVVRASGNPQALLAPVSAIARTLDPDLPLVGVRTLDQLAGETADKQRAAASLVGVFGALGLMLAVVGIYGITAHAVSLRSREIGIRVALGARHLQVHALFVRDGLRLSLIGVAVGLAAGIVLSQLLASFLFGVRAADAVAFIGASVILVASALFASYLPARRLVNVDPTIALKSE